MARMKQFLETLCNKLMGRLCSKLDKLMTFLPTMKQMPRGGLTTQAPQAVAWAGSPAAMEGKARAQCTEASSTWHEHRRGDHTVFSPRLSSVPGSATADAHDEADGLTLDLGTPSHACTVLFPNES
jgi:hypothetical protein